MDDPTQRSLGLNLDPGSLLLSIVISGIGFVAFMYGRKQKRLPHMVAGLALMVYPYFVSNVWLMLGIAVAMLAALFAAVRLGW